MTTSGLLPRGNYRATFAALVSAVAGFAILQSLVLPVLPTVQRSLHTTQGGATWVLTAYLLSASIFTPILGRLGDMYGKKRAFIGALAALAAGAVLSAIATSLPLMLTGRVVQGMGGAVIPLAFGIARDEFPPARLADAIAVLAAVASAGVGVGIVLAGPIVAALGFHWLFWLPMIVIVLTAIAAQALVPGLPTRAQGSVNWAAAGLLSAWLLALLFAVSQAPHWGWGSARVAGLLIAAVVLAGAWVAVEARSATPLVDMTMMRSRPVWTANLVALLFGVSMYAAFAFVPEFVQTSRTAGYGFGVSVTMSGLMLLPMSAAMFGMGQVTGRLTRTFGARNLVIAGSLLSSLAFVFLALQHRQPWDVYVFAVILGIGAGTAFAAMSGVIVAAVPREQTGVASGMNTNIRTIGGSVGTAFILSIITAGHTLTGVPRESGYVASFWVLAGVGLTSALVATIIPARLSSAAASSQDADRVATPHPASGPVLPARQPACADQPC